MSHDAQGAAVLKTFAVSGKGASARGSGSGGGGRESTPSIGDVVEFSVATDRTRDAKRATQIEVIAKASTETTLEGLKLVRIPLLACCLRSLPPRAVSTAAAGWERCAATAGCDSAFTGCAPLLAVTATFDKGSRSLPKVLPTAQQVS